MTGPLDGVRVIDLTAALAGPYCTMILADLGADVIKVEPPGGEVTRRVGPYPPQDAGEQRPLGGYFQSVNRGKRSIVLDLKSASGHAELLDLIRTADVLVENFGPGVVDRLNISYDSLREANPRLVFASLSGFGAAWSGKSPYIDWPAMDITVQAMAGALSITGTEDGKPVKIGPGVGDIFPGTMLAVGILAALHDTVRTGRGQQIDVAMFDAMLSLCERIVYQHSYTGAVPKPIGNTHPILTPFDVLEAKDGWIAVAATTQLRWEALCRIMERPELIDDSRFLDETCRVEHRGEIRIILDDWARNLTRAEMSAKLGGKVPYGPVNDIRDIFEDPHAWARDMLVEIDNPGSSQKAIVAGQPIKFSKTPSAVATRAPLLDEHAVAIRHEVEQRDLQETR